LQIGGNMVLPGETINKHETKCDWCGTQLELEVCQSNAGYYIGFQCPNHGPYSRESNYFKHKEAAEMCLLTDSWQPRR